MARFLGLQRKGSEADLEGAARVGDRVYWISSHGRNSKGKTQPARQRLFATTLGHQGTQVTLEPHGMPYTRLLEDLAALPELKAAAGRVARRMEDSINIEALAVSPGGELLIGLRSPVPNGQAVIVPLLNPEEVVAGGRARLGPVVRLELGGLGIRDLVRWGDRYLILAGPPGSTGVFRLFEWTGGSAPARGLDDVAFGDLRPEAITPWPDPTSDRWLVLSDDGSRLCDGVECKKLKDPARKRFRARIIPAVPSLTGPARRPASPEFSP
jgi:hypothetical protein